MGRIYAASCPPTYLHRWVSVLDVVLEVAHQHQVAGLVPARVQSVVVDVAEDRAGTDTICAVLGINELAETVHDKSTVLALALLLVLLGLQGKRKDVRLSLSMTLSWATVNFVQFPIVCQTWVFLTLDSGWRPRLRR